jgi:hypothetical protein
VLGRLAPGPAAGLFVIADNGDGGRRGLSVALAIADTLHLARAATIWRPDGPEWRPGEKGPAPNPEVRGAVRKARFTVL